MASMQNALKSVGVSPKEPVTGDLRLIYFV